MNLKQFLVLLLIVSLILTAGCTKKEVEPLDSEGSEQIKSSAPDSAVESTPELQAEQAESEITLEQESEPETELESTPFPEPVSEPAQTAPLTDIGKVKDYLETHPQNSFGKQSSRILEVTVSSDEATLKYRTSTHDPSQESVYFAGVLLVKFPSVSSVIVRGYNKDDKLLTASEKTFNRSKYNFDLYSNWFPDEAGKTECTKDLDCADADSCTKDQCINNKCSNVCAVVGDCTCI